jgi:hypothetical protein
LYSQNGPADNLLVPLASESIPQIDTRIGGNLRRFVREGVVDCLLQLDRVRAEHFGRAGLPRVAGTGHVVGFDLGNRSLCAGGEHQRDVGGPRPREALRRAEHLDGVVHAEEGFG